MQPGQAISTAVNTVRDFREALRRVALENLDPADVLHAASALKSSQPA